MKELPSLDIKIDINDINGMSDQELAEYLSTRLAERPEVLAFVKRYRDFLANFSFSSPYARYGEVVMPIANLIGLDNKAIEMVRHWHELVKNWQSVAETSKDPYARGGLIVVTGRGVTDIQAPEFLMYFHLVETELLKKQPAEMITFLDSSGNAAVIEGCYSKYQEMFSRT